MKFMYSEDQAHSPYSSGHDRRCPTTAKTSNLETAEPLKKAEGAVQGARCPEQLEKMTGL
jgi:hypothetical protein